MTTARQEKDIKRLMSRIKDALDDGDKELAKKRTTELHNYLKREGLVLDE